MLMYLTLFNFEYPENKYLIDSIVVVKKKRKTQVKYIRLIHILKINISKRNEFHFQGGLYKRTYI